MELTMAVDQAPDRETVVALNRALDVHNATFLGFTDEENTAQPIGVFIKDEAGRLYGGLWGVTWWGWLKIETLWLNDQIRGQGLGSRLMALAEHAARDRGCTHSMVDTTSWQARPFYEKLGYRVFGELPDFPPPHIRYWLRKDL